MNQNRLTHAPANFLIFVHTSNLFYSHMYLKTKENSYRQSAHERPNENIKEMGPTHRTPDVRGGTRRLGKQHTER
jgi:hypothetical protein